MNDWWVVIASGPSLRRDDCDLLRGIGPTIAVSDAVRFVPWADYLFACDSVWWRHYGPKYAWFKGERMSSSYGHEGIRRYRPKGRTGGNGGHISLKYAVQQGGAMNVALLGFDHQHTNGKAHFFGDHPRNEKIKMANAPHTHHWVSRMNATAKELKRDGINVVNLSRETALRCFPRMEPEQFVEKYRRIAA